MTDDNTYPLRVFQSIASEKKFQAFEDDQLITDNIKIEKIRTKILDILEQGIIMGIQKYIEEEAPPYAKDINDYYFVKKRGVPYRIEVAYVEHSGLGNSICDEVTGKIKKSHITMAEVSGQNPNVVLELGIAMGAGRGCFIITTQKRATIEVAMSNLNGLGLNKLIIKNGCADKCSSSQLIREIAGIVKNQIRTHNEGYLSAIMKNMEKK